MARRLVRRAGLRLVLAGSAVAACLFWAGLLIAPLKWALVVGVVVFVILLWIHGNDEGPARHMCLRCRRDYAEYRRPYYRPGDRVRILVGKEGRVLSQRCGTVRSSSTVQGVDFASPRRVDFTYLVDKDDGAAMYVHGQDLEPEVGRYKRVHRVQARAR